MRVKHLIAAGLLAGAPISVAYSQPGEVTDPDDNQNTNGAETDWAAMKIKYEAEKAAYEAAKSASEMRKQLLEAQQAETKAKLGSVSGQTTITGSTELATGAGNAEAMLLGTRATQQAATDLATYLAPALRTHVNGGRLLLITDVEELSLANSNVYDFQRQRLMALLLNSIRASNAALDLDARVEPEDQSTDRMGIATAAGGILDIASKLGSYFLTDYTLGGLTPTYPSELDSSAVAGALLRYPDLARIVVPANLTADDVAPLLKEMTDLNDAYVEAFRLGAAVKAKAGAVRATKSHVAAILDGAGATADKATGALETFVAGLVAPGTDSPPPLIHILRERKLKAQLPGSKILIASGTRAAAYYTKKNLWTFFGGAPLYTMGGVSMVFSLMDPDTGQVFSSGAIAKHGGYRSVGAVQKLFP